MRIEWLNESMTEACLTRGILGWRRIAVVRKAEIGEEWHFVFTGDRLDSHTCRKLNDRRFNIEWERKQRERDARNWQPMEPFAEARVVRK